VNRVRGCHARRLAKQVLRVVGAVILAVGTGRCTIDRAQGETSPAPAATPADGAAGEAGASQRRPTGPQPLSAPEGHGAKPAAAPSPESNTSDGIVGLTRSQVKSRRGPPTAVRGAAWIYTPEQPGCREMIISEVVTFKRGVVASVELERKRTNKVCGHGGPGPLPH